MKGVAVPARAASPSDLSPCGSSQSGIANADDLASRLSDEADMCRNDGADDIAALLDEARARIEWRPIETAPTDWIDVLVFDPEHETSTSNGIYSAWHDPEKMRWFAYSVAMPLRLRPTHWMPLPDAPVQGGAA